MVCYLLLRIVILVVAVAMVVIRAARVKEVAEVVMAVVRVVVVVVVVVAVVVTVTRTMTEVIIAPRTPLQCPRLRPQRKPLTTAPLDCQCSLFRRNPPLPNTVPFQRHHHLLEAPQARRKMVTVIIITITTMITMTMITMIII
jgi:hypothetical protein